MDDLVKRARDVAAHNRAMVMPEDVEPADDLLDELAAEIERLRSGGELSAARGIARELRKVVGKCSAAELLEIHGRAPWLVEGMG